MAFPFDETYKNKVGCKITVRIGQAIKNGELGESEIQEICAYVLVAVQDVKSHDELNDFLTILSARWNFLKDTVEEIRGKYQTAANIEDMFASRQAALAGGGL